MYSDFCFANAMRVIQKMSGMKYLVLFVFNNIIVWTKQAIYINVYFLLHKYRMSGKSLPEKS